jgi:hypothetical protein
MPLVPSFTVAATTSLGQILVTDTSTGSDGAITDRIITVSRVDNSILGTFDFPLSAGSSINISPFLTDIAVNISISWNNSGGASIYNANNIYAYTQYGENYFYSLTQQQQAQPFFLNDQQYFKNKSKLRVLLDSATQAIAVGKDVFSANISISLYQLMLSNPTLYF